jgi:hypothetical protein
VEGEEEMRERGRVRSFEQRGLTLAGLAYGAERIAGLAVTRVVVRVSRCTGYVVVLLAGASEQTRGTVEQTLRWEYALTGVAVRVYAARMEVFEPYGAHEGLGTLGLELHEVLLLEGLLRDGHTVRVLRRSDGVAELFEVQRDGEWVDLAL